MHPDRGGRRKLEDGRVVHKVTTEENAMLLLLRGNGGHEPIVGVMTPRSRRLAALAGDLDFIPSTQMTAHGHMFSGNPMPSSLQASTGSRHHIWCIYIHASKHRMFIFNLKK